MIEAKHYAIAATLFIGLATLLSLSNGYQMGLNIGYALSFLLYLFILTSFIYWVFKVLRKPLGQKPKISVFYILMLLFLFSQVSLIAKNNRTSREQAFIDHCEQKLTMQVKDNPSLMDYDLRAYCSCAAQRSKKIKLKDTAELSDPNSAVFMEMYGPCWESAKIKDSLIGIQAEMGADTIKVINLSGHIQVKTKVNGKEVYMIFDSGASDLFISREFLDQFSSGQVEYLEEYSYYNMADGSQIKAQLAKIQRFDLGKFKIQDMKVAVAEEVVNPLLGKSILDQFSSWTINSDNQLILAP